MRLPRNRASVRLGAGATAVAAVAAFVAIGAPARAEEAPKSQADLVVSVPDPTITLPGGTFGPPPKSVRIDVTNRGPIAATNLKVRITVTNPAAGVDFGTPPGCTGELPTFECAIDGGLDPFAHLQTALVVGYTGSGFTVGQRAGTVAVTVEAAEDDPDTGNNTHRFDVTFGEAGADLGVFMGDAINGDGPSPQIPPGGEGAVAFTVLNQGSLPVGVIDTRIVLPRYVSFVPEGADDPCKVAGEAWHVTCRYEAPRDAAGRVVPFYGDTAASGAIKVKVAANAPGSVALQGGSVKAIGKIFQESAPEAGRSSAAQAKRGFKSVQKGKPAALRNAQPKLGDEVAEYTVFTGRNTIDLAAVGDSASGRVGEIVQLTAGYRNNGPADATGQVVFTAPGGTEFAQLPEGCVEVKPKQVLSCGDSKALKAVGGTTRLVAVGESVLVPLKVKIVSGTVTDGSVKVQAAGDDAKPGNDTAALKIKVITGLPVTGATAGLYGGVGLGVLVLGGALLLVARRRRVVLVTPGDGR
jgi:hypothetical protein